MEMRPPSRILKAVHEAIASGPSRFSSGTRQSVKTTSEVSLARMPSLFSFLPGRKPDVPFSMMNAEMPCEALFVGDGHGHADVGVVAVGGEGLRAVEDPVLAVAHRHGARAAGVGAGFGLGERPAAELFALRQRDDVFALLLVGAELVDVVGAERIVRGDDEADGAVDARELFDGDDVFDVAEAGAAVFLGEDDAQKPELRQLGNELERETRGLVPLHDVRGDFGLGEIAHGLRSCFCSSVKVKSTGSSAIVISIAAKSLTYNGGLCSSRAGRSFAHIDRRGPPRKAGPTARSKAGRPRLLGQR